MRNLVTTILRRMSRGVDIRNITIFESYDLDGTTLNDVATAPLTAEGNQLVDTTVALFNAAVSDDVIAMPYRYKEYTFPRINLRHLIAFSRRNGYNKDMLRRGDQLFNSSLTTDFTQTNVVTPIEYKDLWELFLNEIRFRTVECTTKLAIKQYTMEDITYIYTTDGANRLFYSVKDGDEDAWFTAYGLGLNAPLLPLNHMGKQQVHVPNAIEFNIWAISNGKILNDENNHNES